MGLLDAVLGREQHVFHTALPPDECRRRLPGGLMPAFPTQTPIVNPFVTTWTSSDHARLRLTWTGGKRRPAPRIMRVHLIPEGTGTVVEGTTELAPTQLVMGLFLLTVFGFIGVVSTSYYLSRGHNLFEALFPFGYAALFVLIALLVMIAQPSDQVAVLVDNLGGVLEASSIDGIATSNVAPVFRPAPVPAPQFVQPVVPSWPPISPKTTWRTLPRDLALFSPLRFDECVRRIGPDSGDAGSRWTGSGGTGLAVAWKNADEVELSKSGMYRRTPRHVVRARLTAQLNGTQLETSDMMSPSPKRIIRYFAAVFCVWGLVLFAWGGRFALLNLLPFVVFVAVFGPVQYFLNRRATANQHAFVVATLQSMLGAVPATGPDADVR
jgi:hypothetical protein